jgi:hypothetical protein
MVGSPQFAFRYYCKHFSLTIRIKVNMKLTAFEMTCLLLASCGFLAASRLAGYETWTVALFMSQNQAISNDDVVVVADRNADGKDLRDKSRL